MAQRNRISTEVKERLVRAFEEPTEDYLQIADTLGVNRSTARGIIARYVREGRVQELARGGPNNAKVDEEMRECLNEIIDEKGMLTLREINTSLRARLPNKPQVHERTIARTLDGMLIILKDKRPMPSDRTRPDVIQSRYEYASWFLNIGVESHCVFIDECGYNIWTARSNGRTAMGERAYRQVCGQRGRNVTVVLAISARTGLVQYTAEVGGMNNQRFNDFLVQTRQRLPTNDRVVFIYDNTPARNVNHPGNSEFKPLPPYSPFLNIVEESFSYLKAAIKAYISSPDQQRLLGNREEARRRGLPLGEFRKTLLLEAITRNLKILITQEKCMQWYNHMQTYLLRCVNREEIEGKIKTEQD